MKRYQIIIAVLQIITLTIAVLFAMARHTELTMVACAVLLYLEMGAS